MSVEPHRVDEIFYRAQTMPPEDRDDFLDQACRDDAELRREVQSLLAAVEDVEDDFLERPLIDAGPETWTAPDGRLLGTFRILREIGRGGMSRVFLAVRDDPGLRQEVAVKILKWGIGGREAVRRFERERQILARLEHPYVARFLDGGTTDDGLPYVVMERVEGEPIDRYCALHRLSVRECLELFQKVCSAVQFAHQNLIVHRDLKPGNVLVTADGTPKLLDFGIAKLLHDDAVSTAAPTRSLLTATGLQPMTLAFASPEQVRGEVITTASDVYSLGVILYQLLAGSRPYGGPDDSALELARAVCEDEATKPSTAAARNGRSEARRRRLSGDLDSIVLKALEKDPRHRYASVEQLVEDLERHLDGRPVQARDATVFYRLGKYLRRRRWEVLWVLAVFLIVVGFSVHSMILRNRALQEKHHATMISDFMVEVFEQSDPEESEGKEVTARELLDESAARIVGDTTLQPEVQAALLEAMASAYIGLGLYAQAEPLAEQSLRLRRQSASARPDELASSLLQVADVRRVDDRLDQAKKLVEEALRVLRRGPADAPDLARALNNLALLEKTRGDHQVAERLYREALAMKIRLFGEEHEDIARGKHNLAATLRAQGEYDEAEKLYGESLELRIELDGEKSSEVASARNSLAVLLQDKGDLARAEPLMRQNLALRREIYGDEHPKVATALNNLAFLLQLRGKLDEAAVLYRQALEIRRRTFGEDRSSVARVLRNYAVLLLAMDDPTQAESTVREALEILRQTYPKDHWRIADATSVLGTCLAAMGRTEDARPLLTAGYHSLVATLGENARQTREALRRLEQLDIR